MPFLITFFDAPAHQDVADLADAMAAVLARYPDAAFVGSRSDPATLWVYPSVDEALTLDEDQTIAVVREITSSP